MSKIKHEIAVVVGVVAGVAEIAVQSFPSSQLSDIVSVAIPIIAAFGIRANVVPLEKLVGPIETLLPVVVRLEQLAAGLVSKKPAVTKAIVIPVDKPKP